MDEDFWGPLRITADEAEYFATLDDMEIAADAVVVGRFEDFALSRVIQGAAVEDVVGYAVGSVRVAQAISGAEIGQVIPVEFMINVSPDQIEREVTAFAAEVSGDDMLMFLRAKRGDGEEGLWRVVNSYGLWTPTTRAALDTPLVEDEPRVTEAYADELTDIDSITELIDHIAGEGANR